MFRCTKSVSTDTEMCRYVYKANPRTIGYSVTTSKENCGTIVNYPTSIKDTDEHPFQSFGPVWYRLEVSEVC